MQWYEIVLIVILASLVLGLLGEVFFHRAIFDKVLKNPENVDLDQRDLKDTQYEPLKKVITEEMVEARKKPSTQVFIQSFDGLKLCGHYYQNDSKKLFLLFHGYQATYLGNFSVLINEYYAKGYQILAIDERAHGKSEGEFCSMGGVEPKDLLTWIDYADQAIDCDEIYCYGVSMGAMSLAKISDQIQSKKVKALMIDCGFVSTKLQLKETLRKMHTPRVVLYWLMDGYYKKLFGIHMNDKATEHLKNCVIPCLFIHGDQDHIINIKHAYQNYEACGAKKELVVVHGADHAVCLYKDKKLVIDKINKWIGEK